MAFSSRSILGLRVAAVLLTALATPLPQAQAGLIINAVFDGSITQDANVTGIENTINTAIQAYQNLFRNDITVSIYFQEGGGLGQSEYLVYNANYADFYAGLVANNGNPAAIAALQANGGNANTNGGLNPATGTTGIEIKSANARAVGGNIAPGCVVTPGGTTPNHCAVSGTGTRVDGIISLNTSITTPPQGSGYSLLSVTEHEIDEVLGLGSSLENVNAGSGTVNAANDTPFGSGTPEDLFRWDAATNGSRTLSTNCAIPTTALFAYGPSTGAIASFNNSCNGADFGDWANGGTVQVQDAFGSAGSTAVLGSSEISALTAVGYTTATPEPGTWGMLLGSMAALALVKRRV